MTVTELFAKLGLDIDGASFSKADTLLGGIKKGLQAAAAVAAAAGAAISRMVFSVSASADQIDELSQRTGVGTTALQELAHAASFSGLDVQTLAQSMGILQRNIAAAARGSTEARRAFKGIQLKDAAGNLRSADAVMGDLAEKFSRMPDGTEKAAIAMQAFGRGGGQMIPLLNAGREGLAGMRKEAHDLGLVLDESTIKKGAQMDDEWTRLKGAVRGVRNAIAGPLLGSFVQLFKGWVAWIKANRELIKQRIDKVVRVLGKALEALWKTVVALGKAVEFIVEHWKLFALAISSVVIAAITANISALYALAGSYYAAGLAAVSAGLKAAATWALAAAPIVVIAAIIAAIILVAEDLWVAFKGGDSLLEKLYDRWNAFIQDWLKPNPDDPWWMKVLKAFVDTFYNLDDAIKNSVAFWKKAFADFFNWFIDGINALIRKIPGKVRDVLGIEEIAHVGKGGGEFFRKGLTQMKMRGEANARGETIRADNDWAFRWLSTGRLPGFGPPVAKAPTQINSKFNAQFNITAAPGQTPEQVAGAARTEFETWFQSMLNHTGAATGVE